MRIISVVKTWIGTTQTHGPEEGDRTGMSEETLPALLKSGKDNAHTNNENVNRGFAEPGNMNQETSLDHVCLEKSALFAVCGGMGSYENEASASNTEASKLLKLLTMLHITDFFKTITHWMEEINTAMGKMCISLVIIILIATIVPCASLSEEAKGKNDMFNDKFQLAGLVPSEIYASGAVFDLTRIYHDEFETAVRSSNAISLLQFFAGAYSLFCEHPEILISTPLDMEKEDTDYRKWNTDIFPLESGDFAALCYMPISNNELEARIIGIILSEEGDGYYYCMLDKDDHKNSTVYRNRAMRGPTVAGKVKGRGFELMQAFLSCIQEDFSAK